VDERPPPPDPVESCRGGPLRPGGGIWSGDATRRADGIWRRVGAITGANTKRCVHRRDRDGADTDRWMGWLRGTAGEHSNRRGRVMPERRGGRASPSGASRDGRGCASWLLEGPSGCGGYQTPPPRKGCRLLPSRMVWPQSVWLRWQECGAKPGLKGDECRILNISSLLLSAAPHLGTPSRSVARTERLRQWVVQKAFRRDVGHCSHRSNTSSDRRTSLTSGGDPSESGRGRGGNHWPPLG